jgi:hypothetical protein
MTDSFAHEQSSRHATDLGCSNATLVARAMALVERRRTVHRGHRGELGEKSSWLENHGCAADMQSRYQAELLEMLGICKG